jgi:hypothetical protein
MTECKIELGLWAAGVGMAIDIETGDVTMVEQRQSVYNMAMRQKPGVVLSCDCSGRGLSGCGEQIPKLIRNTLNHRCL